MLWLLVWIFSWTSDMQSNLFLSLVDHWSSKWKPISLSSLRNSNSKEKEYLHSHCTLLYIWSKMWCKSLAYLWITNFSKLHCLFSLAPKCPKYCRCTIGRDREFQGIFTPFYTINFLGLCKSWGASAPAAPPSSAPMPIPEFMVKNFFSRRWHHICKNCAWFCDFLEDSNFSGLLNIHISK